MEMEIKPETGPIKSSTKQLYTKKKVSLLEQHFLEEITICRSTKMVHQQNQQPMLMEFKGWAHLARFDDVALVDQFKRGLKPTLGRKVIETGNPGDGTTPGQSQRWYNQTTELE